MKDYTFEYSDTKLTLKIFIISVLTFILLVILAVGIFQKTILATPSFIAAFGVPILIFYLNRKKIKKQGQVNIYDTYFIFILENSSNKIEYLDIREYQVERYNGVQLNIMFKDDKIFKLQANSTFCNPDQFDFVCDELEKVVLQFKTSNNVELKRRKSLFEQAWLLPILIITTVVIVTLIIISIYKGQKLQGSLLTTLAVLGSVWVGYLTARGRKKKFEEQLIK